MLTIQGSAKRYCDGISRRSFLSIGGLGIGAGAFGLTDLLRAEARAGNSSSHKAVIHVFLGGGPPHQDMWDIKAEAPSEIRGEFKPIATKVAGIQIGECFPQIAARADKFAFLRAVVDCKSGHDAIQCLTGWGRGDMEAQGGRPSLGAVVDRVQGAIDPSVPPFVGLAATANHSPWSDPGQTGFLGMAHAPFKPHANGLASLKLRNLTLEQLSDRRRLIGSFDALRHDLESLRGADAIQQRAFGMLTSSKLVEALDLTREDPKVRDRYGDGKPYQFQFDGAPTCNDQLLMARRLVEAGVRVVTLSFGRWDSHAKNFDLVRDHGRKLDQGLGALIDDLDGRGMLNDVTIIAWGEFGRTPRINANAGRDHWPQVSCALLAGGGMNTGQVIGSTDRLGEGAKDRPVTFAEVVATLYHNLGINPSTTTVNDPTGRPQHVIDAVPLRELV